MKSSDLVFALVTLVAGCAAPGATDLTAEVTKKIDDLGKITSQSLLSNKGRIAADRALIEGTNEVVDFEKLRGPDGGAEAVRLVETTKFSTLVEKMRQLPEPEPLLRSRLVKFERENIWITPGRTGFQKDFELLLGGADMPNLLFAHASHAGKDFRAREKSYRTVNSSFLRQQANEAGSWQILYLAYQNSRGNTKGIPDHLGSRWSDAHTTEKSIDFSTLFRDQKCSYWVAVSKAESQRKAGVRSSDIIHIPEFGSHYFNAPVVWSREKCSAVMKIWPAYKAALQSKDWTQGGY